MALNVLDPLRYMDDFDRTVGRFFGPFSDSREVPSAERAWRPATDLVADSNGYSFRFDLPGVDKSDIDIHVESGVLTVSGERKDLREPSSEGDVYRREAFYGRFQRAFRLPEDADPDSVKADYQNGVLEVHVGKSASERARKIPIGNS